MLQRLFDKYFGIWATQRIICVGNYAIEGPSTLEDVQQWLYNPNLAEIFSLNWYRIRMRQKVDRQFQRVFDDIYSQVQVDYFPAHQQYVLLNFDTKEYVLDRFYNTQLGVGLAYERESSI